MGAVTSGDDERWMEHAMRLAERAAQEDEVPVGAVMVYEGALLAEGWNQPVGACDPTAHAEIIVLRKAAQRLGNYRLGGTTLYVTLEPCPMCAGAMVHARVQRLVYGAADRLAGAAGSVFNLMAAPTLNHRVLVEGGVLADDCSRRLKAFFQARR